MILSGIYFSVLTFVLSLIFLGFALIANLILIPFGKNVREKFAHKVAINWARTLIKISFSKVVTENKEYYDKNKTRIIILNHQSSFDIFYSFYIFDGDYRFVSKKSFFKIPILGFVMKKAGYICVKPGITEALKIIDQMESVLKNGKSILMYPEGMRTYDGNIAKIKKGLYALSERCPDVEILPVILYGTRYVMPNKSFMINMGLTISARMLKPFLMKDIPGDENEKLAYIRDIMQKNYDEMKEENKKRFEKYENL